MKKNRFRVDLRKLRIDPDTIGPENLTLPHSREWRNLQWALNQKTPAGNAKPHPSAVSDDMIRGSMDPLELLELEEEEREAEKVREEKDLALAYARATVEVNEALRKRKWDAYLSSLKAKKRPG